MNELRSTIYELLVKAQEAYGEQDAIRYKVKDAGEGGKKETKVRARTYTQLREDSERFSAALAGLGAGKAHCRHRGYLLRVDYRVLRHCERRKCGGASGCKPAGGGLV